MWLFRALPWITALGLGEVDYLEADLVRKNGADMKGFQEYGSP
jgi:hypothetical protein